MLKSMDLNHLEEILDFSWQLCGSLSTSTYPIPKTKEDLKQSFLQKLQHEDDQVLMYFKTNQLIGVIALFVETKEQYVKLGTYIKEDLEKIMDEVIAYLKHRYPSYKVHFTYPKENVVAIEYLKSKGYPCIEASNDLRLELKDLQFETTQKIKIEHLKKEEFIPYAAFHEQHGGEDMYWNSKRLYEAFDRWYIYVYREEGKIVASSLTCKSGEGALEVFGVFLEEIEDKVQVVKELLGQTIQNILGIEVETKQVIYFIEDKDVAQYTAARELGFQEMGSFRCYAREL